MEWKLTPYNIKKGILYLRHFGPKEFFIRLRDRMEPEEVPYAPWYESHRADEKTLAKQKAQTWENPILISVAVPLFHTPPLFLEQMIGSLREQTYPYWELCLANGSPEDGVLQEALAGYEADERIRIKTLSKNLGIAENTNEAVQMAKGDYIGLLDHDDLLAPDALYEVAKALWAEKEKTGRMPEMLYTDEDKVRADLSEHLQPNLKPDFNPDLLRSNNYICHFLVFSRALFDRVGGLDEEYDGAQDYDFILRCTEISDGIVHIPRILYHWRLSENSTADNPASKEYAYEAGQRAIEAHLTRMGLNGEVSRKKDTGCYRVKYHVKGNPLVSVIIPNKDEKETLRNCLTSIIEKTTWKNYEIIVVENNSETPEIFNYYKEIDGRNGVRVVYWDGDFNYSAINNFGISKAKGDFILCLNNDTEVISPDWMTELLSHAQRPGTGIAGARLYYPDDTIQHAGMIIGIGGVAGNVFTGLKRGHTGYMHRESLQQDLSAVTAACMMIKRDAFNAAGGFEEQLAIAFNDADFCLKVREAGYLIVYDPYAELYHYESKTRGAEDTNEKARRFQNEIEYMRSHWTKILREGDPYYNPNLSLSKWNYSLRS